MDVPLVQSKMPFLGFGLGLRPDYYEQILTEKPDLDWFELLTENYMVEGGKPLYYLEKIRADYAVVLHGVSLSIGSTDPLDWDYLQKLKNLSDRAQPAWISDHLCWTGIQGINTHDLLPIPYTRQALNHIASRIDSIQNFLKRPILIENVSSYLSFKEADFSEWDFIAELVKKCGCFILLDVNNVYVSSVNHQFNPFDYINAFPLDRVAQIHLAGHSNQGNYIIDTHDAPIIPSVWELYEATIKRYGLVSTMVERDDQMPALEELLAEIKHAKSLCQGIIKQEAWA